MVLFQCIQVSKGTNLARSLKGLVWDLEVACFPGPHSQIKQGQVLVWFGGFKMPFVAPEAHLKPKNPQK